MQTFIVLEGLETKEEKLNFENIVHTVFLNNFKFSKSRGLYNERESEKKNTYSFRENMIHLLIQISNFACYSDAPIGTPLCHCPSSKCKQGAAEEYQENAFKSATVVYIRIEVLIDANIAGKW